MHFLSPRSRLKSYRQRLTHEGNTAAAISVKRFAAFLWANRLVRIFLVSFTVFLLLLFFVWYFFIGPRRSTPPGFYNSRENAVWLEHSFAGDAHTAASVKDLIDTLTQHDIRYVYLHVGPILGDGSIDYSKISQLKDFMRSVRANGDRIVFLAWLGQIRSKIPLEDATIRRNIGKTARRLMDEYGMGGVHLDIEPVFDGDTDFIFLLEDVRAAIMKSAILSVALPEIFSGAVSEVFQKFMKVQNFLSPNFVKRVAAISDQVVIMTYENSIPQGWLYEAFLKHEVIWSTRIFSGKKLFIGLPTYDTASPTFYPQAENIHFGLPGVIHGLDSWRSESDSFRGIALYRYSTTDEKEWSEFSRVFLGKQP